jgi:hypothetical protein
MSSEAIDERPTTSPDTSRGNGIASPETMTAASDSARSEVTQLAARIEHLERQQRLLKRDSLLIAGLTTVAAALALSVMLQKRFEPPQTLESVGTRRAISAQEFLLTDPQGHPRAKLTFE